MKISKFYKRATAIGLIMLSFSILIRSFVHLPDFASGLLTGISLGIEIYALIIVLKLRKLK